MTDLEYDLHMSLEWWVPNPQSEEEEAEVDHEETAKNLAKLGYQKIVWHDVKKELPDRLKNVLGYNENHQVFVVVKWGGTDWSDENEICYNVDYWAELPKIKLEK